MRHSTSRFEYKMVAAPVSSHRVVAVRAGRSIVWPFLKRSISSASGGGRRRSGAEHTTCYFFRFVSFDGKTNSITFFYSQPRMAFLQFGELLPGLRHFSQLLTMGRRAGLRYRAAFSCVPKKFLDFFQRRLPVCAVASNWAGRSGSGAIEHPQELRLWRLA
jgi:hypothetical protein